MAWEASNGPGHTLGIFRVGWVCRKGIFQKEGLWCQCSPGLGLQQLEAGPQKATGRRGRTALAGWAGACAQLVGVADVFAVVGVQVLAKAECSRLVTLAGLLLAGRSAGCGDKASQGPEAPVHSLTPALLEAHSHGDVSGMGERQGGHRRAARPGCWEAASLSSSPSSLLCPPPPSHPLPPCSWSTNSHLWRGWGGGGVRGGVG